MTIEEAAKVVWGIRQKRIRDGNEVGLDGETQTENWSPGHMFKPEEKPLSSSVPVFDWDKNPAVQGLAA